METNLGIRCGHLNWLAYWTPVYVTTFQNLSFQGPASTGLPMPGPGFFSSPERPTGAYNAGRYIPPGGIDSVSTQLHPPRPGFIGTIGSPVSNAQTPPRAAVADKTGKCQFYGLFTLPDSDPSPGSDMCPKNGYSSDLGTKSG